MKKWILRYLQTWALGLIAAENCRKCRFWDERYGLTIEDGPVSMNVGVCHIDRDETTPDSWCVSGIKS